jgi:hypothetical protein
MQFGIFGKFPFLVGSVTLFPLLGIQYDMVLAKENAYGNKFGSTYYSWYYYKNGVLNSYKIKLSDLNTFWFKL